MKEILRTILKGLFWLLTRPRVIGSENVPAQGPCIIAANHLGFLDGPFVFAFTPRKDMTTLVARKYRRNPFFHFVVDQVGGIWLDRFILEVQPLKLVLAHLRQGGSLGIAPEGTRSRTQQLQKAKNGVAFLVAKVDAPVVPAAITGTEDGVRKLLRLQRPIITLRFGQPFRLPLPDPENRSQVLERNTDEIMCRIAALLPEKHRGVYCDHPRLKELLTEDQSPAEKG